MPAFVEYDAIEALRERHAFGGMVPAQLAAIPVASL